MVVGPGLQVEPPGSGRTGPTRKWHHWPCHSHTHTTQLDLYTTLNSHIFASTIFNNAKHKCYKCYMLQMLHAACYMLHKTSATCAQAKLPICLPPLLWIQCHLCINYSWDLIPQVHTIHAKNQVSCTSHISHTFYLRAHTVLEGIWVSHFFIFCTLQPFCAIQPPKGGPFVFDILSQRYP